MKNLTVEEYNVLERISSITKMDCWFSLGVDDANNDVVVDLEADEVLSLEDGISQLDSGITSLDDYDLTDEEKQTYRALIHKVNMTLFLNNDRLMILLKKTFTVLEENVNHSIIGCDLEDEIGITQDEYEFIMNANNEETSQ